MQLSISRFRNAFNYILTREYRLMKIPALKVLSKVSLPVALNQQALSQRYYFATSIKVFTPLIFSPCINFNTCFIFLRETAA